MALRTPLYDVHVALKARMVDFGGWEMPVQYPTGILKEHTATREAAGLFDTCHMGEFLIEGDNVRAALNCALTGDFTKLKDGRARYTFITDNDGNVVDDAVVMVYNDTKAWMVVNAGDTAGDFAWFSQHLPESVTATNISDATCKLDVQGPRAWEIVKEVTGQDFRTMPFYSFSEITWQGREMVFSRSGYTGEPGVELYVDAAHSVELWETISAAGAARGLLPCGLGARDTLRLEAGMPLYGHELSRDLNPLQAGFERFVKLEKAEDFPGRAALESFAANPAGAKKLVGLNIPGKRVPRQGFAVLRDGATIGIVTSGAPCPTVGNPVALAYVEPEAAKSGTEISIDIRGKEIPATVVELPFYSTPLVREKVVVE